MLAQHIGFETCEQVSSRVADDACVHEMQTHAPFAQAFDDPRDVAVAHQGGSFMVSPVIGDAVAEKHDGLIWDEDHGGPVSSLWITERIGFGSLGDVRADSKRDILNSSRERITIPRLGFFNPMCVPHEFLLE